MQTKDKINCLPSLVEMNLSRKGYRITTARKKLIEFIINFENDFVTISDYKMVEKNLNIATFYNNINLLIEANIIGTLKDKEQTKYFLKSKVNTIVKCNNCESEYLLKVKLIEETKIENIVQTDTVVYVSGCKKCQVK